MSKPKAPPRLGRAGRKLWADIVTGWELDSRELAQLTAACRQADDAENLEAILARDGMVVEGSSGQPRMSAIVTELRQSRLALSKMLLDLRLPSSDTEAAPPMSTASMNASKAARTRWDLQREREGRPNG